MFLLFAAADRKLAGAVNQLADSVRAASAADPCWDWGSGKLVLQNGEHTFIPDPCQVRLNNSLRDTAGRAPI